MNRLLFTACIGLLTTGCFTAPSEPAWFDNYTEDGVYVPDPSDDVIDEDAGADDAEEAETSTTDATVSDTAEADVTEQDVTEEDTTEDDASEGDVTEEDTSEEDTTEDDASEGDVTEEDTTEDDASEGDATEEDTVEGCTDGQVIDCFEGCTEVSKKGDGVCDEALNCLAQAFDGGDCAGAVGNCGNWECEPGESGDTCPNDCMAYVTLYLETQCSSDFDDTMSACLYSNQIEDFQTCAPMQPTDYAGVFTFSGWLDVSKTFEYVYGAINQGELALLETSLDIENQPECLAAEISQGQGRLRIIDPDANMNYYDTFGACEACPTECGDGSCWGAGESPISCPSDCAPSGLPLSCTSVGQAPIGAVSYLTGFTPIYTEVDTGQWSSAPSCDNPKDPFDPQTDYGPLCQEMYGLDVDAVTAEVIGQTTDLKTFEQLGCNPPELVQTHDVAVCCVDSGCAANQRLNCEGICQDSAIFSDGLCHAAFNCPALAFDGGDCLNGGDTESICGDGACTSGETNSNCPIDCLETIDPGLCEGLCDAQAGSCSLTETQAMGETHYPNPADLNADFPLGICLAAYFEASASNEALDAFGECMAAAGLAVDTVTIPTSCAECFGAYWQCGIQACEENCASDTEGCVGCVQSACYSLSLTCLGCGDGECGAAEDSSSCPEDCAPPVVPECVSSEDCGPGLICCDGSCALESNACSGEALCKQQDIAAQFAEPNGSAGACYLTLIQTVQDLLSSGQANTALAITEAIDTFMQCSRVVFQEALVPETCRNCHLDDLYCRFNAFMHPSGACFEACNSADDIDACNTCISVDAGCDDALDSCLFEPGNTDVVQINRAVGESANEGETTCARRSDGSVWCWGGATGLSTGLGAPSAGEPATYAPSQINLAAPALAIAGHGVGEMMLALLDTGEAFVWENTLAATRLIYESTDLPVTNITHIDANKQTACVVADGKLSCLIRDDHHAPTARLADNITPSSGTAFEVRAAPTAAEQLNDVIDMCMTDEAVCVLQQKSVSGGFSTASTEIRCWGALSTAPPWASDSDLEDYMVEISTPQKVSDLGNNQTALVCGANRVCALDSLGGSMCWGSNQYGQLGQSLAPTDPLKAVVIMVEVDDNETVQGLSGVAFEKLVSGNRFNCGRTSSQQTYCWGDLSEVGLNYGCSEPSCASYVFSKSVATMVKDASGIAGLGARCLRTRKGEVLCRGNNNEGQLGQPPTDIAESSAFISVPDLDESLTYCLNGGCGAACVVCDESESCVEGSCQAEYADNQDGTVTQNTTALMWMQCALPLVTQPDIWSEFSNAMTSGVDNCPAPQNPGKFRYCSYATNACNAMGPANGDLPAYNQGTLDYGYGLSDAYDGCEQANDNALAGHTDWRVPTADELQALIPFDTAFFDAPTVQEFGLGYATPVTPTMSYWSANSFDLASAVAVTFDPPLGKSVVTQPSKQQMRLVRCVRDN